MHNLTNVLQMWMGQKYRLQKTSEWTGLATLDNAVDGATMAFC